MKKTILLTTILAMTLAACGSKAESLQVTTAAETETAGIEMSGKDFDTGDSILSEDPNANNNKQEKEVAEETEEAPEIVADNAASMTSQVSGPPYVYDVGGVVLECNINIYDYIYEKNNRMWFNIKQMAADRGYNTEYLTTQYMSNQLYYQLDDGSKTIVSFKTAREPYNDERRFIIEDIGVSNTNNSSLSYLLVKYSHDDVEYRVSDVAGIQMISLNQMALFAYILDISPEQGADISPEAIASLEEKSHGIYYVP